MSVESHEHVDIMTNDVDIFSNCDIELNFEDGLQYDFISQGANQVYSSTLSTYLKVRDLAYDRNTLINYGFDRFESICKKTEPYAKTLYDRFGNPLIAKLDYRVNSLIGNLSDSSSLPIAVTALWLSNVNDILRPHIDVTQSLTTFSRTSTVVYLRLSQVAVAGKVKYEDFQRDLQIQLQRTWNASLANVSEKAFEHIQQRVEFLKSVSDETKDKVYSNKYVFDLIESTKNAMKPVENAVISAFSEQLQRPAYAFYNYCVDTYMQLAVKAKEQGRALASTDLTNFLDIIKAQMSGMYNDKLEQTAKDFFERALQAKDALKSSGIRVLTPLNLSEGKLMIQDYYFKSKAAAGNLSQGWLSYFGITKQGEMLETIAHEEVTEESAASMSSGVEVVAITAESEDEDVQQV